MAANPLVIPLPNLGERLARLHDELETDAELRSQFVSDPAGVLSGRVLDEMPAVPDPKAQASAALMASLLHTEQFVAWADGWREQSSGGYRVVGDADAPTVEISSDEFFSEAIDKVFEYGDQAALAELFGDDSDTGQLNIVRPRIVRPTPGVPVNVNVNVNVNVFVSLTVVAIAALIIPVIVLGVKGQDGSTFSRGDLKRVTDSLSARAAAGLSGGDR